MSKRPVLPLWVADFQGDTQALTTAQVGAYLLLLMEAWADNGSLPDNDAKLARITRLGAQNWARSKNAVLKFWKLDDDGRLRQKRLTNELDKIARISEVRSEAAKKRPVDNPVESCGKPDPALSARHLVPKNENRSEINGHFEQLHTTLNPRRKKESFSAVGASDRAREQQQKDLKNKISGKNTEAARQRQAFNAARATWETELAKGLAPDTGAEVFDYLSAHPEVCDRATRAQLEHGTGAGALAAMRAFHQHATQPRRSAL